jgi:hypothetical protein
MAATNVETCKGDDAPRIECGGHPLAAACLLTEAEPPRLRARRRAGQRSVGARQSGAGRDSGRIRAGPSRHRAWIRWRSRSPRDGRLPSRDRDRRSSSQLPGSYRRSGSTTNTSMNTIHDNHKQVSDGNKVGRGLGSVQASPCTGAAGLRGHTHLPSRRNIWASGSTAARCRLGRGELGRGRRQTESGRISTVRGNRTGFSGRGGLSSAFGARPRVHRARPVGQTPAGLCPRRPNAYAAHSVAAVRRSCSCVVFVVVQMPTSAFANTIHEHDSRRATIEQRTVIERILAHLGLPVDLPSPAPARSPEWLPGRSD